MDKFKYVPFNLPADGSTVWADRSPYYGEAFQATYTAATFTFTSLDTGLVYPAINIARWRYL
jgi:hypothetical protein